MKALATIVLLTFVSAIQAQTYNVAYGNINFGGTGVTITNKVGNGMSAGDVVLYENVITVGTQQIDGIVRTVATSGMINFDNPSTSGGSMSNNQARFFSPQFNFSGAGSAEFRFEFILGGSYNNATDSGDIVTLQNVKINTYDIDGNGSSGTNQYNEYGGFDSTTLGASTNIVMSYNTTSGLTKFRSNTSSNISNVLHDDTRVKVSYTELNSFTIRVGADAGGYAYFFIDFGPGGSWSSTPDIYYAPTLDLFPGGSGNNRSDTFCSDPAYITGQDTNLITSGGNVDEIYFEFLSNQIYDGANEYLIISGASSGDSIPLNFSNGASISNITLSGVTYTVSATVGTQYSKLSFAKSSGTMTEAEAEELLDSMKYWNRTPTSGIRDFNISVRELSFVSPKATFSVLVDCSILPVQLVNFKVIPNANKTVDIQWETTSEINNKGFIIERSVNGSEWHILHKVEGNGNTDVISHYRSTDAFPKDGENCYRLIQEDMNGTRTLYDPQCATITYTPELVVLFPNPTMGKLSVSCRTCTQDRIRIFDNLGTDVTALVQYKETNVIELDLSALNPGVYYMTVETNDEVSTKSFTLLR